MFADTDAPAVYGRALAGIAGSNTADGMDVSCEGLYCQVEVSASGCSLVQRSPAECGRFVECDRIQQ